MAEMKETQPELESHTQPVAPEPEHYLDPQTELNPQTDTQDKNQDVSMSSTSESVPAQDHMSTDDPAPAELVSGAPDAHLNLDSPPAASLDEAENTPTSQSAGQTQTG